ncbi:hypothetical protein [Paenibacillus piri]|uniref:Uncharacterized protein n=1 Tax=Paenibacillus piri TaxID=2547395 RepID=A0A4R5K8N4_9BACL|nr:hypothetical protein [Paenibacillus piri]TDF91309.1 hypothetical protein E1757_32750 [Paenibacillus piri]
MDPIDDELKKGLADGPLIRDGFSETLKKRIMERAEEQSGNPKQWLRWSAGICAGLLSVAVFLSVEWNRPTEQEATGLLVNETTRSEPAAAQMASEYPFRLHSALLIGLRKDYPQAAGSSEYSTYRTVLLAPEDGSLRRIAEGDGIVMPYKTDFMKIAPQSTQKADGEYRSLHAFTATGSLKMREPASIPPASARLNEKLLFAGNRYLALAQTIRQKDQTKENRYEYVWVKDLQELASNKPPTPSPPQLDPHVSLTKVLGDSVKLPLKAINAVAPRAPGAVGPVKAVPDENGESWTIVRKQGEWVPQVASYNSTDPSVFGYQLHELPVDLPNAVVSYDRLSAGWDEIRQIRPDAKDAFSSPNDDIVGIISEREITVYPFDGQIVPAPLLTINLAPNESVVMLQWAAEEPYIEMWKQKGKLLLH